MVATKQMVEEEVMDVTNVRVVKLMVKMKTVPECVEGKVERFMPRDTVIFMISLHRMEQCRTRVDKEYMLM